MRTEHIRVVATNPLTCVNNLISTVMCSFSMKYSSIRYESCSNRWCRCDSASSVCLWFRVNEKFRWIRSALKFDCMRWDIKRDGCVGLSYLLLNKIDNFASSWRLITWEYTGIDLVLLTPCACASVRQHFVLVFFFSFFFFLVCFSFSVLFTRMSAHCIF